MKQVLLSALGKIAPVLSAAVLLTTAMQASAAMVTSIHTGHGSGTIDGEAFDADFAITTFADTSTITSCGDTCLTNMNLGVTIYIDSIGVFSFITPTNYIADESGIAFTRADGTSLFESPTDSAWDMASTLPPVLGFENSNLLQWLLDDVVTTGGVLVFNDGITSSAFTATVDVSEVPVPAGIWLLGSGLVGLVGIARRKA